MIETHQHNKLCMFLVILMGPVFSRNSGLINTKYNVSEKIKGLGLTSRRSLIKYEAINGSDFL